MSGKTKVELQAELDRTEERAELNLARVIFDAESYRSAVRDTLGVFRKRGANLERVLQMATTRDEHVYTEGYRKGCEATAYAVREEFDRTMPQLTELLKAMEGADTQLVAHFPVREENEAGSFEFLVKGFTAPPES